MTVTRQLSLFGIEAAPPGPDDLAGLLAGPGQIVRMGGTARVSVVVDERWRAAVLVAEMRTRGLAATCVPIDDDHLGVRTPYATILSGLARAWLPGAVKSPPPGFALEGRRLRLWTVAAGYRDPLGLTLRIGRCESTAAESTVAATLQRALKVIGLASGMASTGAGPALRIIGRRRLARFAEIVGDPPEVAPDGAWP